jgi:hypothetical protein
MDVARVSGAAALWTTLTSHAHGATAAVARALAGARSAWAGPSPTALLSGPRGAYGGGSARPRSHFPTQGIARPTLPSPTTLRTVVLPSLLTVWVLWVLARGHGLVSAAACQPSHDSPLYTSTLRSPLTLVTRGRPLPPGERGPPP